MRIPTFTPQYQESPLPNIRRPQVPDTGLRSLGAALGDVSSVISHVREQEQLKADQAAFMEADRVLGENENSILNDPTSGALNYRGKDAMDVTPKALEEFDLAASKAQTNLKTDRQRLAFGQALQNRRQAIERTLMQHESREREQYYAGEREAYKQSAQSSAITNFRDPVRIEQEIDKARAAIDQTPGLSAEERAAELGERRSAVYGGVIDRYLANDEVGPAERYYATVRDRVGGETAANIERALRIAKDRQEAKKESGLALSRAELAGEVQDIEATFRSRLPVEQVPPESRFVELYGDARGRKMYDQVRLMADASADSARLTQLSTDEVMRVAQGYAPTRQQGAAVRAEIAGIIQQQAAADLRERADDPAGYLVRHSPAVQATWKDLVNGTGDASRYVTSVRGEQDRLGLPPGDLLPDDYATEVAARIANAGAEGMVGMIRGEADRWGNAWPEVYGQLAPKMTDAAAVIGSGIPTYAADALASTAGLKTNELQAMIPSGITKKDIDDEVAKQFDEFNQSFPVDAARTVSAFNDAATRLAIRYMQQGTGSASAAVEKAYNDLVTHRDGYQLVRNSTRDVTYRVPKQYDPSVVEGGAESLLSQYYVRSSGIDLATDLPTTWDGYPAIRNVDGSFSTRITATVTTSDLNDGRPTNIPTIWQGKKLSEAEAIRRAAESGIDFPAFESIDSAVTAAKELSESIGAARPTQSEEDLKAQMNAYVHENGYWMTTPDESGLRLYVDGGPLVTGDGPVQYTWDEIAAKGMEGTARRQQLIRDSQADQDRALREGLR
jgi:hypothetical protein